MLSALVRQLAARGLCPADAVPQLGLVYAHATAFNENKLMTRFAAEGWHRFGPDWLNDRLCDLAQGSYENSTASIVTKLLTRSKSPSRSSKAAPRRPAAIATPAPIAMAH